MFQHHWSLKSECIEIIFTHRRLKLVAFGLLLYSLSFLIRFLHPFLSLLSLSPAPCSVSLSLVPSSTPFIRAALACRYMNTTMDCVCVSVTESERDEMGLYNVQQMTQNLRTGPTQPFNHINERYTVAAQFNSEK